MPLNAPIKDRVISSRHLTTTQKFKGSNIAVVSEVATTPNIATISREYIAAMAVSLTNITLSGPQTINGVSITAGMTVLVNGQTDKTKNGPYICQSGAWTRVEDINMISGFLVVVRQGTGNANTLWMESLEFDFYTPDVTELEWINVVPVVSPTTYTGAGTPTVTVTVDNVAYTISAVVNDGSITTIKLADGSVATAKIQDNAVTTLKIVDNAVTTAKIIDNAVTTTKIVNNAVTDVKILDGAVTTNKIANLAVTSGKIANSAVTATQLANNAVTTAKILDANVTTTKIANLAVTEAKLADGSVTVNKIGNLAVTTAKLADLAVTTAKLADGSVTTAKIVDANVTTAKLADFSVTEPKLASLSVSTSKIQDSAVTGVKIANGAVGTSKLADDSVTNAKMADDSVGANELLMVNSDGYLTFYSGAGVVPEQGIDFVDNKLRNNYQLNSFSGALGAMTTNWTFRFPSTAGNYYPRGMYHVDVRAIIDAYQGVRRVRHVQAPTMSISVSGGGATTLDTGATHADPPTGIHNFFNNALKGSLIIDLTSTTMADRYFEININLTLTDFNGTADRSSVQGYCHIFRLTTPSTTIVEES